jgi:predicted nucleic acid-binding protein
MARLVLLDASMVIALWQDYDAHHEWGLWQLGEFAADDLVMPSLTLTEALVHPAQAGQGEALLASIETLRIGVLPFDGSSALSLATTRASTGLKLPDALVLHEAGRVGAALATCDRKLESASRTLGIQTFSPFN